VPAATEPTHGGPQPRVASPSGGSTLMTSAPRSPSSIVQYVAASTVEQSMTRRPASGPGAGWSGRSDIEADGSARETGAWGPGPGRSPSCRLGSPVVERIGANRDRGA